MLVYMRADTPEELELLKKLINGEISEIFSKENSGTFAYDQPKEQKKQPTKAFLQAREEIKKGNTILCCVDNTKIYYTKKIQDFPGCYCFFDKEQKLVYVGSTKLLSQRIPQSFIERKGWNNVSYIGGWATDTVAEARELEARLISKYNPKLNIAHPDIPGIDLNLEELNAFETTEVKLWEEHR